MKKITVPGKYNIYLGIGIIGRIREFFDLDKYSKIIVVTDKKVESLFDDIKKAIPGAVKISLNFQERNKDINLVAEIWEKLLIAGADRKTLVINVGGGVAGDAGGFAASTFMRGVDFIQIPTTLLAQVDAASGGKTGINFSGIKNLIGTFRQPVAVIIDITVLETLPQREFISGFAEIIKHGAIADKRYFKIVTAKKPLDFSKEELLEIIQKSCQIKADIVSADEEEKGMRKLLNFGHTIGHAVEALSQEMERPILHGEAISIGMLAEAKLAVLLGLLDNNEFKLLQDALGRTGLPVTVQGISPDKIMEKIISDKKNEKGQINWTLPKGIGEAVYNVKADEALVRKVL